jgi:hypothetical protein
MGDLQRHIDDGWIQEGMILFYETGDLQSAKVNAGLRVGQRLELPKETEVELGSEVLLKFRVKSRCLYCKADVVHVAEDTFTVELPNSYQSLPRRQFYRIELSRWGRFNDNTANIKDLSVAGAAIEVSDLTGLEVGKRYKFQTGRFSTNARINEIDGNLVRVQFPIRANLNIELSRIVREAYRQTRQRTSDTGHRRNTSFSSISSA